MPRTTQVWAFALMWGLAGPSLALDLSAEVDGVTADHSNRAGTMIDQSNIRKQRWNDAQAYTKDHPEAICSGEERCWSILRSDGNRVHVLCEQGPVHGSERCVASNAEGAWSGGCGITDTFAFHHRSLEEAAKYACGL